MKWLTLHPMKRGFHGDPGFGFGRQGGILSGSKAPTLPITNERLARIDGARIAILSLVSTILLFFAAEVVGSLLVSLLPMRNHDSVTVQFVYGLLADALMLGGIYGMLRLFGWNLATIGLKSPKVRHIFLGALTTIPYYLFLLATVLIIGIVIPSFNTQQKQELGFDSITSGLSLILTFLSLVILPPIVEEIAMRGFLYTGLRKWLPKVVSALVVSALFGAAHLAEGGSTGPLWIGAIDTFTLSLFLVFLRELTGNLWAGITLHTVKNLVAFIPFLLQRIH